MIKDEIKKANIQAMKDKNVLARNLYSVILNKIMLAEIAGREAGKELTDADVVAVLQKALKELAEEKQNNLKAGRDEAVKEIEEQEKLLAVYMPKMLSGEEIKDIILALDDKSIPSVMRHFKTNYAGQCDMRLVQETLKGLNG